MKLPPCENGIANFKYMDMATQAADSSSWRCLWEK